MSSLAHWEAWWLRQMGSLRRSQAKTLVACMEGLMREVQHARADRAQASD